MIKGIFGRNVLSINVHQFRSQSAFGNVHDHQFMPNLVFSHFDFVSDKNFSGWFYQSISNSDMTLFACQTGLIP
jgi:hypothetical protein